MSFVLFMFTRFLHILHFRSHISCGWRHTMALTNIGELYGWSWNKFGQVGVGDNVDHCSPVQVKFPHDQTVVCISCGWRHTLAVTECRTCFHGEGAQTVSLATGTLLTSVHS